MRRTVLVKNVAPRYFGTVGMHLLSGRDFQVEDESRPRVAIVFGEGDLAALLEPKVLRVLGEEDVHE